MKLRQAIANLISDHATDGKWHSFEETADAVLELVRDHLVRTLSAEVQ